MKQSFPTFGNEKERKKGYKCIESIGTEYITVLNHHSGSN